MMLSFQNLHQFVFNLSQVTSVVSSTYIRLSSTSVKKKPEIDVYCSENFLNTLKTLEQSENLKFLNGLEHVRFGPKFQDMHWIFSKNVNFRFTAEKPVNKPDFYLALDKNDLKVFCVNSVLESRQRSQHSSSKKILAELESKLMEKSKWSESFVSKNSFDENKQSYFCGKFNNNPLCSQLTGTLNFYSNSREIFSVQKRGFKTKRALDSDTGTNFGLLSKFGKNLNKQLNVLQGNKTKDIKEKVLESPTVAEMIKSEAMTPEDKMKLKVSFAEGYMVAVKDLKKPESMLYKIFKAIWVVTAVLLISSLFFSNDGIFNFSSLIDLG